MGYSDLCIRTADAVKCLEMGRQLRLDVMGLVVTPSELAVTRKFTEKTDWRRKPRMCLGVEARTDKHAQAGKLIRRLRKSADLVVAFGGTPDLNRAILDTPEADVLMDHDVNGRCGINHVLAKIARKNDVAIAFDFNQLMSSYRLGRVQEFSAMAEAAALVRKFDVPFVLTSGARDPWDMRSPSELLAMGAQLGFTQAESRKGLSDRMMRKNRKRLSGKWIMPGVEIE